MARQLSVKATAVSSAVIWGGAVLGVGIINTMKPRYGKEFLQWTSSIYPGYKGRSTLAQAGVAGGYAAVDGAICGALFALIYNALA